jgi:RNA polymerase sigma factor (TIGR02999 family)
VLPPGEVAPYTPGVAPEDDPVRITQLLERARTGDPAAVAEVTPLVYDALREIAARQVRGDRAGTLQTTALVHEAYLRLLGRDTPWESRAHFYCMAARAMRSILIDHARARKAQKRGGAARREPFHDALAWFEDRSIDLLALEETLDVRAREQPRQPQLVELRFFAGLTTEDAAQVLGVSRATAERDWAVTRAWLRGRMTG